MKHKNTSIKPKLEVLPKYANASILSVVRKEESDKVTVTLTMQQKEIQVVDFYSSNEEK